MTSLVEFQFLPVHGPEPQETEGRAVAGRILGRQEVGGELQLDELVVGKVVVERPHDPVTVELGVRP